MRYYLYVAGPSFVSCSAYATFKDAEDAYFVAVAKIAFGVCAAEAVVLMTSGGRVIYAMG